MLSHRTTSRGFLAGAIALVGAAAFVLPAHKAAASHRQAPGSVPQLIFPVVGAVSFRDDFGEPRARWPHPGNDLVAAKRSVVLAVERGSVRTYTRSASAGCMLYLYGDSGTMYEYIHLNNDSGPGNDNQGGCSAGVAWAAGLKDGQRVEAGQPIAFVGDSGDANGGGAHLHFEVHPGGGVAVTPYPYLLAARRISDPVALPRIASLGLPSQ